MTEVQQQASLHEKAVQAIAKGEVKPVKRRRTRGANKPPEASEVRSNAAILDTLDEEVRAEVKALITDLRHVQVISSTEVIVWNHPAPWPDVRSGS